MIVIVTAMDKEYDLISEWIAKNWLDYKNVQNIALIKSGIGKVNAASCLTEFLFVEYVQQSYKSYLGRMCRCCCCRFKAW